MKGVLSEIMTAADLDLLLDEVPSMPFRRNDGRIIFEALTLVGCVAAADDRRDVLSTYGIFMDFAIFDLDTRRWQRCLFSAETAQMLVELKAEGQLPFSFEAAPSAGQLAVLKARVDGRAVPRLPLRAWVTEGVGGGYGDW